MRTIIVENTWLNATNHGWGNGYVLLPKGHKYHGVHYDDIPVDVHGRLTFSELVDDDAPTNFNLKDEDQGGWLIGFDTAHSNDTQSNWPKEKVQEEANYLLEQLSK